jgi:hypothetical protein
VKSVAVIANNQQAVIARTIASILYELQNEPFELVIVSHGCFDRTFEIALR